jgi:hypothetical protein
MDGHRAAHQLLILIGSGASLDPSNWADLEILSCILFVLVNVLPKTSSKSPKPQSHFQALSGHFQASSLPRETRSRASPPGLLFFQVKGCSGWDALVQGSGLQLGVAKSKWDGSPVTINPGVGIGC